MYNCTFLKKTGEFAKILKDNNPFDQKINKLKDNLKILLKLLFLMYI